MAFMGWALLGGALSMPAVVFYLYRHDPAPLHHSDHWVLMAGMAPVGAVLAAWWTARNRLRPLPHIALRTVVLLLVSFFGTAWVLESNHFPTPLVQLVSIFTGWASIVVLLLLVPLLNLLVDRGWPAAEPASAPAPRQPAPRPTGRGRTPAGRKKGKNPGSSAGDQNRRPRPDGKPPYRMKPRDGKKGSARHQKAAPSPRGDGKPVYRQASAPRAQGDGKPVYRQDSIPRPRGDGKPLYRDEAVPRPRGDGKPVYRDNG
jgi:hypothetical protein